MVKNTLAKRALKGTDVRGARSAHFEGTTAVAYTEDDPVALAKTLTTFMKTVPALQIKAAVVQGQAIKAAEVTDLANLPGKPELYAKLLFVLQAPATNLVRVLSAVPRDLMTVLGASREEAQGIVRTASSSTTALHLRRRQRAMAEVNQQQVVDYIKGISVMELSQLVKTLETELGVSAAAAMPMMAMPMMGGGGAAPPPSKRRPSSR